MSVELVQAVLFYVCGALALGAGVVVIAQRNPMYSAFALITTLCSLSVIYALLGSPFIAVLQVVVYAGAIMVLFLFVLMLLNAKRETDRGASLPLKSVAVVLALVLLAQVGAVILGLQLGPDTPGDASTHAMARELFSPRYIYPFEATSILILAALVGAVVMAKKDL
jgi:NADH-quinone oxidoreductase subunit J